MFVRKTDRDEELVNAWNAGDERAFSVIYDTYWNQLLAIAYRLTQDKEQSEEIVQEVFVSLWRRRHDVRIDTVPNYLATAVKFATFKSLQRTKRHEELQVQEFPTERIHLDDEAIDAKFLKEYLDGIVEHLPEKCKLVFRMSREDLKSNKEISGELAISEKAVEAHITKALKVLKLSLRKAGFAFIFILFF
ncbi:MAG TPA: RNA polymerase sigma-70 factor [Sphingobacterium sp.]|nr:RNA polymerase sigma-70 factor [Sphingobacterium sp.]